MRRAIPHLLALVAGVLAAVLVAACGSEDRSGLLLSTDAQAILEELDTIQSNVADGRCSALGSDLSQLKGAALNLPNTVDRRLRARINDGVANLEDIAPDECTGQPPEEPEETPTPETETQTETQETTTSVLPEPTETPTVEPTATPTPDTGGVEPPEETPTPDPGGAIGDEVIP